MKNAKKLLAIVLSVSLLMLMTSALTLTVNAAAPTATCTVEVTEQNIGTGDYYVAADITFESEDEFTAGLFTVEAADLTLTDCTVKSATGGESPETQIESTKNKVIFTGFSNSEENDFRSYTSLTLTLKFSLNDGATSTTRKVTAKDITLANVDEVKFVTADAEGTAQTVHNHTVGENWEKDGTDHWKVCTECQEKVDKAAHTYDTAVKNPTCTEGGYTTYTCTVCGYSYTGDETNPTEHTLGDWLSDEMNHWRICSECQNIFDEAAHTFEWEVTKIATPEEPGLREEICSVCGYKSGASEPVEYTSHLAGDINGDGSVNNKDLTRLFQYLSDWDVEVSAEALDVNGDGSVNNKDLTRLFQYLSDWDVEIY